MGYAMASRLLKNGCDVLSQSHPSKCRILARIFLVADHIERYKNLRGVGVQTIYVVR